MLHPVSDLKMAHEQQTKSLEEEFEKIRLSLQVSTSQSKCSALVHFVLSDTNVQVNIRLLPRIRWTR